MKNFTEKRSYHPFAVVPIGGNSFLIHRGYVIDMRTGTKLEVEGTYDLRYQNPSRSFSLSNGEKIYLKIIHGNIESTSLNKSVESLEAIIDIRSDPGTSTTSAYFEIAEFQENSIIQKLKSDFYISILGSQQ